MDLGNRILSGVIETTRGSYQTITLNNVTTSGNHYEYGGVMKFGNTPVIINDSSFFDETSNQGGAIQSKESATITDSKFSLNKVVVSSSARSNGGAIIMSSNLHSLKITDTIFEKNTAEQGGGDAITVKRCKY